MKIQVQISWVGQSTNDDGNVVPGLVPSLKTLPKSQLVMTVMMLMVMIMMTIMVMINMLVDLSNFQAWFHPSRASQSQNNSQGPTLYDAFILYAPRDEVWRIISCIINMILHHHHHDSSSSSWFFIIIINIIAVKAAIIVNFLISSTAGVPPASTCTGSWRQRGEL